MIDINDPIEIQRRVYNNQDIISLISFKKYFYLSPTNHSLSINSSTKVENEEIIKNLDKKLEFYYKKPYQRHSPQQQLIEEYETVRSMQQEKLIRYCISNDNMLLINSSVIPIQSKFNRFSRFYNCQDLQFKYILYTYKQNYDSLLNLTERKFTQFNDFINKFNKGGSIEDYLSQSSLSDDEEIDKDSRNENDEDESEADDFINDELNYELKLQLINNEIKSYWNCCFLRLFIYFKLNNFEKLVIEFFNLIGSKAINSIDPLQVFKNGFEGNGIVTKEELTIIVTLSILIVTPSRNLEDVVSNENNIRFLENYKDESLLKILKLSIDCQFSICNQEINKILDVCSFHTSHNHSKISVILRQKQYMMIMSSMSRISLKIFSDLMGVDEDLVEFEVLKLIEFLNLRVEYENHVFQISDNVKEMETLRNVESLNQLYNTIEKNAKCIRNFNEIYG